MRLPGDFRGRIGMNIVKNETDFTDAEEKDERRNLTPAHARPTRSPWYRRLFHRDR
jgi:hypothetical protein